MLVREAAVVVRGHGGELAAAIVDDGERRLDDGCVGCGGEPPRERGAAAQLDGARPIERQERHLPHGQPRCRLESEARGRRR